MTSVPGSRVGASFVRCVGPECDLVEVAAQHQVPIQLDEVIVGNETGPEFFVEAAVFVENRETIDGGLEDGLNGHGVVPWCSRVWTRCRASSSAMRSVVSPSGFRDIEDVGRGGFDLVDLLTEFRERHAEMESGQVDDTPGIHDEVLSVEDVMILQSLPILPGMHQLVVGGSADDASLQIGDVVLADDAPIAQGARMSHSVVRISSTPTTSAS